MTTELHASVTHNGVPVIDTDPFDPAITASPHAFWTHLRELTPVAWVPRHGCYIVARHAEVKTIQEDWQTFTTSAGAGLSDIRRPDSWRKPGPIVEVDPPRHTAVRKVVNRIVSPIVVRGWRERFEAQAQRLVRELVDRGTCDGVRDIAEAYVLKVFPESIGMDIPREHAVAVGDHNFNGIGPRNALYEASQRRVDGIADWWHRSLGGETMRPGGFGEQLFQAEAAGELAPGLAGGLTMTFLRGGLDTTISSIGSALWLLATHPDQWRLLKADPGLIRGAFEETIRLESPIQTNFRTTTRACTIAGLPLAGDTKVQLLLGSANRDPRKWQEPDRFDIRRDTSGHVALGSGIHACVGQMIARLEFECVMKAVIEHCGTLELAGAPEHRANNALRTLDTLPLRMARA